ncbi:TolC family protein [Massilia sp. CF038]|uniref:TolC family protein n=1 Tax=Massilia sp. CF038 TaxID=1881045 RepID=UPI000918FB53|nr:TolC family protein [Massilia sp. CF038]SHH19428.1 Outer membrane protein TolC [Massilia sp. CF038]
MQVNRMWSAVVLAACAVSAARAQEANAVSYGEALHLARQNAGAVQGAQLDMQAKQLQAAALRRIDGPDLRLSGFLGRVSTSVNLDTSGLAQAGNPIIDHLPQIPGLNLPEIPNSIGTDRIVNLRSLGLASVWPLYTGGRLDAVKQLAAGRAEEAGAALQTSDDELANQLAQRYFSVQLAREAARLRTAAVAVFADHQAMAGKLERTGLISKVERLKADVAMDNAKREAAKASSDLEIAQLALNRLLGRKDVVQPNTPLFVHGESVGSLSSFIERALASNAAFKQVDSKRTQAEGALKLQGSAYSPTVVAVANYNLNRGGGTYARANWLVGMSVSVPLVDRIDKAKMREAARLEQQRVEVMAEQANRDIPTLTENQWRTMENARLRYLSMQSAIELAQETLRLAQVGFKNAQATSSDVADASLNLTKSHLERAQAAYEYDLALAKLLGTTGQPERLAPLSTSAGSIIELTKD